MRAEAKHGKVLLTDYQLVMGQLVKEGQLITREEALELLASIANAIHMSGDISDPPAVRLHEAVRTAVENFKTESA